MADFSLLPVATIQAQLNQWLTASTKIAQGQEYTLNGRHLRRADLEWVGKMIADYSRALQKATGTLQTTAYARFVTPYQDGDPMAQVGSPASPFQPIDGN